MWLEHEGKGRGPSSEAGGSDHPGPEAQRVSSKSRKTRWRFMQGRGMLWGHCLLCGEWSWAGERGRGLPHWLARERWCGACPGVGGWSLEGGWPRYTLEVASWRLASGSALAGGLRNGRNSGLDSSLRRGRSALKRGGPCRKWSVKSCPESSWKGDRKEIAG